jgi:hypothetical protein
MRLYGEVLLNIFVISTTFHFSPYDLSTVGLVLVLMKTIHGCGISRILVKNEIGICRVQNAIISSFHRQHFIFKKLCFM